MAQASEVSVERRGGLLRWALAAAIALGTLAGVLITPVLAVVLSVPRFLGGGFQPEPGGAALGWLVSTAVAGPATTALLWLLGGATLVLSWLVAADAPRGRVWRAYTAWAVIGGVLTTYALVANWDLAREAGVLALLVGGAWSATIGASLWYLRRRG